MTIIQKKLLGSFRKMFWFTRLVSRTGSFALKISHVAISFIIFVVIMSINLPPCFSEKEGIVWTEEELAFMEEHPVILIDVDPGFAPYEFFDENGRHILV